MHEAEVEKAMVERVGATGSSSREVDADLPSRSVHSAALRDADNVLLLNPPVLDTRMHWARFHQPTLLLRIATHFRTRGRDVRLIDALDHPIDDRLKRTRVASLDLDGTRINKWRFGREGTALVRDLRGLAAARWSPDAIFVACEEVFWWEGAAEMIATARECFPGVTIILTGGYAERAPQHATDIAAADIALSDPCPEVSVLPIDLSLYPRHPRIAAVTLGAGTRSAAEIVDEMVAHRATHGIRSFTFPEYRVASRLPSLFRAVLERIIACDLRCTLFSLGSIAASDLIADSELATLMRRAGHAQVYFADDRDEPIDDYMTGAFLEATRLAIEGCHQAGFPARTDALMATVCLGRAGEDLAARARLATSVAHHAGSVVFWPYQPSLPECPNVPLEDQNGKLFPLRTRNEATYRTYLELLGLTTVLNAKYRTHTFDFMGDALISRMFRDSVQRRAWEPDPSVKGTVLLPAPIRRD